MKNGSPSKPEPIPAESKKQSLPQSEIDFSNLPDEEVYPCCLWEYARESLKVRELVSRVRRCSVDMAGVADVDLRLTDSIIEMRNRVLDKAKKIKQVDSSDSYDRAIDSMRELVRMRKLLEDVHRYTQHSLTERASEIDREYDHIASVCKELLSDIERDMVVTPENMKRLEALQKEWEVLRRHTPDVHLYFLWGIIHARARIVYLAANGRYDNPTMTFPDPWIKLNEETRRRLAGFWPLIKSRKSGKGSKVLAPPDPVRERAFSPWTAGEPADFQGIEDIHVGKFQIKWEFTNEDITIAFRDWLKKNRPLNVVCADRRGQDLDHYRVALRRLDLMRSIRQKPESADAEQKKDARHVLEHFREFVKGASFCDGNVPGDCATEYPKNWPECLGNPADLEKRLMNA